MQAVSTDDVRNVLLKVGIKPSIQRIAILRHLMSSVAHPTVDEIYRDLHPEFPMLSRTTVYNTVWLLADKGAINTIYIDRNNARFDYAPTPHAHFRCSKCGKIIDAPLPSLPSANIPGATINSVSLYFIGLCADCNI